METNGIFQNDYYLISSDYKLIAFNESVARTYEGIKVGDYCYKATMKRDTPCLHCPIAGNSDCDSPVYYDPFYKTWIEAAFASAGNGTYAVTCRPATDRGLRVFDELGKEDNEELIQMLSGAAANNQIKAIENKLKQAESDRKRQLDEIRALNTRLEESSIEQEEQNQELTDALSKVKHLVALSGDYEAVHIADLDAGSFDTLRLSERMLKLGLTQKSLAYETVIDQMLNTYVVYEDRAGFRSFLERDSLIVQMKESNRFTYRYAIIPDESGHYIYEMTFVRVGDDPQRHLLVMGTKCIDDILRIEREEGQYNAALLHDSEFFYEFDVTDGYIRGRFSSKKGYQSVSKIKIEFPIKYDDFNKIRGGELGLEAATPKEASYWTCAGLLDAFEKGKRSVEIRYSSAITGLSWTATIVLVEDRISHHLHAVYICKDVTELKEAEQRQKKELEDALDAAKRASIAKSDFLSRMSHDIRTPLNGIIGLLELSEAHSEDPVFVHESRMKAKVAADHLLSLINDVLDMSKLEDGRTELADEPFNLSKIGDEVITICGIRAKEHGITLKHDNGRNIIFPNLYGSPLHVKQIMMNLINNGIKYNKPDGSITCETKLNRYDETTVWYDFVISDTGIGIGKEFLEHIYEPFTQEKSDARSRYQGTGMGMAIVKSLVDKMNGTIQVDSEVGVGTTFTVTLPFRINCDAETTEKSIELQQEKTSIEGMRILIAEDNELNMEIVQMILEDAGAIITTAENGAIAYQTYMHNRAGSFDAILMDIMMPEMNGYEATEKIRKADKADAQTIPIIAMTANAFLEDVKSALSAGMNEHLAKPIETEKLKQTLAHYRK